MGCTGNAMQGHPALLHEPSRRPAGIPSSGAASALGCFPTGPRECLRIAWPSTLDLGGFISLGPCQCELSFDSAGARRASQHSQHGGKTPAWPGQVGAKLGLTGPAGSSRICAKTLGCFCTMEVDEPGTVARRGCCRAGETASSLQLAQRSANEA